MTRAICVCLCLVLEACSRGRSTPLESTAQAASAASAGPRRPDAAPPGKPFGAACIEDAECSGGVCFHKRLKTPDAGKERRGADDPVEHEGYCSIRCNDDSDCPVPLTKGRCGARGMCKRPD
jgi:hypothetical protein